MVDEKKSIWVLKTLDLNAKNVDLENDSFVFLTETSARAKFDELQVGHERGLLSQVQLLRTVPGAWVSDADEVAFKQA